MRHWLIKAEPTSRIEKGKDVKFSVDDFESVQTTPWEGVRNHEAKKLMQSMKVGDQVLFYHSNCKNPGVAAFAEVSKEAYPDYTAWDPEHPYYDVKSDKNSPKWFMVDVTFKSRATHFVPLALFKLLAGLPGDEPPTDVAYIGTHGVRAIKGMALIKRGRLSVQPVEEETWAVVRQLAERGGWDEEPRASTGSKSKGEHKGNSNSKAVRGDLEDLEDPDPLSPEMKGKGEGEVVAKDRKPRARAKANDDDMDAEAEASGRPGNEDVEAGAPADEGEAQYIQPKANDAKTASRKRKAKSLDEDGDGRSGAVREAFAVRRSTRARR